MSLTGRIILLGSQAFKREESEKRKRGGGMWPGESRKILKRATDSRKNYKIQRGKIKEEETIHRFESGRIFERFRNSPKE